MTPRDVPAPTDGDEAHAAVERATARLTESYQRWPKVRKVAGQLETVNTFNHFGDKLAEAYRSQPRGPSH